MDVFREDFEKGRLNLGLPQRIQGSKGRVASKMFQVEIGCWIWSLTFLSSGFRLKDALIPRRCHPLCCAEHGNDMFLWEVYSRKYGHGHDDARGRFLQ